MTDGLSPGGAEQLMPTLLNHFDRDRFEFRVCVLQVKRGNPIAKELKDLGIDVDLVQIHRLKDPFNIFRILRYLKSHPPDLIHTQLEFSDILGNLAAKILHKPSVSTLHTLDTVRNYKFSAPRQKLKWFILRYFCDQIIAVSHKTREHHIKYGRIPEEKIKTIHNGIQLSRFQKHNLTALDLFKQNYKLNPDHKIITTVAVLREPKGIQFMINALPAILEKHPNVTYLIIGEGSYRAPLQNLIMERKLNEHVIMTGHRTDIPEILALSDLFVLPSLGDALPTVLIEALAAGIPIVATEVGGIPEIIQKGINGLLVPPASSEKLAYACLELIQQGELARKLASEGLKTAYEQFDVRHQVQQLESVYQYLLDRPG